MVMLVYKGNIMKFIEGVFWDWGYELVMMEFWVECVMEWEFWILGNKESNLDLIIEVNVYMIDFGYDILIEEK